LSEGRRRRVVDDRVLLIGDAAGLAYPHSGEGIRPAVESGLIAASTIVEAHRGHTRDPLRLYEVRLRERFGRRHGLSSFVSQAVPSQLGRVLGPLLLRTPLFVRHVLLDRWFLHTHEPALALVA
jgi:flavin-dependent dehydrogenase